MDFVPQQFETDLFNAVRGVVARARQQLTEMKSSVETHNAEALAALETKRAESLAEVADEKALTIAEVAAKRMAWRRRSPPCSKWSTRRTPA